MQGNPARNALISDSVITEKRATAFSVLMSVSQMVNFFASSAGGYIAITIGYHLIFYVCIIGDLIGILLLTLYLRETLKTSQTIRYKPLTARLKEYLLPEKTIWKVYLIAFIMGLGYGTGYSLFYGSLVDSFGFNPFQLGLLSTTFSLTWGISSIPIGKLIDRVGRKPMLMVGSIIAIISVIGYISFYYFEAFLFFNGLSALDPAFWIPSWMAYISENVNSSNRSTILGKVDAFSRMASIPAPWIGGVVYSNYGFHAPLTILLFCLIISGIVIYSLK
jgi:MFS family permease